MRKKSAAPVQGHHTGAAQAQVVLQCQAGAFDLTLVGSATQLMGQLIALGKPGSPSGWPLDNRPPDGLVTT